MTNYKTVKRFKVIYTDKDSNEVQETRSFTMPQTAKNYADHLTIEGHTVLEVKELNILTK